MKIHVNHLTDSGKNLSITLKEDITDDYPEDIKKILSPNLIALLKVFGILTSSIIYDAHPSSTGLMDELMELLERFAINKTQENVNDLS